ncbi:Gfo/Idh/MocA family oxidoreductase [Pelagibacterales bacterium SAG-MED15]|nr:Gfo/Idh/MocA family oxidoreductase [Pelagibacterales bacterium SAG-MED15]
MNKKINIGIIGGNFGYKVIYRALKNIKDFRVMGFSVKKKSNRFISEKIKIYKNWKNLISDKKIDAIFISSPPLTHRKIIEFAIKKNKHIFCDKPVSTNIKNITMLCKKLQNKRLVNFVNYEFRHIEAFRIFKIKYLPKIKVKKVKVNWSIKIPQQGRSKWKDDHTKGGGNFFNYICHILFYLEDFFGILEIYDSKLKNSKNKFELKTELLTKDKKTKVSLNFRTIGQANKSKPYHKIIFHCDKGNYCLFTKMNNLFDQFLLLKNKKILFKPKEINYDFRLKPTYRNLVSFKNSIVNRNNGRPNFENALRIHFLINEIINFKNK